MLNVETPLGTYCKLGHKIHTFGPCIFVSGVCAGFCCIKYTGEAEACRIKFLIERSLF